MQQTGPSLSIRDGGVRDSVLFVFISPPAIQKAKGQSEEVLKASHFVDDDNTVSVQQLLNMIHRPVQLLCRMKNVGREDDIDGARLESEQRGILLDIKFLEAHERVIRAEHLAGELRERLR